MLSRPLSLSPTFFPFRYVIGVHCWEEGGNFRPFFFFFSLIFPPPLLCPVTVHGGESVRRVFFFFSLSIWSLDRWRSSTFPPPIFLLAYWETREGYGRSGNLLRPLSAPSRDYFPFFSLFLSLPPACTLGRGEPELQEGSGASLFS